MWTDSDETWWTGWVCRKDEMIRCCWTSESGSGRENYLILKSDSLPLRERGLNRYVERYLKKLWTDPDETWWTGWVRDEDKFFQFW